jgi:O-succinylbenzoic acid--CoA ligase
MFDFLINNGATDNLWLELTNFIQEWHDDSPYLKVKTSGSTGTPKTIVLNKKHMAISAKKTIDFFALQPNNKALLCLSLDTIGGKMMVVRAIIGKMQLVVVPVISNPLNACSEEIDFMACVPLQIEAIVNEAPQKLKNIRHTIVGGGPVSDVLNESLIDNQICLYHTFGMTETISHIALRKIGWNGTPLFTALEGIHFSEKENRLIVDYPALDIHQLQTNDVVRLVNSTCFEWIGRSDFTINSGGKKFNPYEIEQKLATAIFKPFFVHGLPDAKYGQIMVLFVESNEPFVIAKKQLLSVVEKHAIPKYCIAVPEFVRTESGKINRLQTSEYKGNHVVSEIL